MKRFNKDPKRIPLYTKMQMLMRLDSGEERIHTFTLRFWRNQPEYEVTRLPNYEGLQEVNWKKQNHLLSSRYRRYIWMKKELPFTVILQVDCKPSAPVAKMVYLITDKHI